MVNVGVIGCGKIAERHLQAYHQIEGVEVTVADLDSEIAQSLAQRLKVSHMESPEQLLNDSQIDVIDVCVPTRHHRSVIIEALHSGKDAFCEKPLCITLDEAQEIERTAARTRRRVMVGYLYRFHPAFQFAKQILDEGILGEPYYAIFRLGGRGSHRAWKHSHDEGGGAILEMMVHKLDLINWFFGDVRETELLVERTLLPERTIGRETVAVDAEDCVVARLEADGVTILCEADLVTPSYMDYVEIQGTNGSLFTSILHFMPTVLYCKEARGIYNQGNNIYTFPAANLFVKELEHFLITVRNGWEHENSIADSIKVMEIIEKLRAGSAG